MKLGLAVAVSLDGEAQAVAGGPDVAGAHLGAGLGLAVADDAQAPGCRPVPDGPDQRVVLVDHRDPVRRQRLDQLLFGLDDPLHRLEPLQVLRADRGQDADARLDQVAEEADVAGHVVAKLGHEHLVGRLELLAQHAAQAHRRVVAAGRLRARASARRGWWR